MLGSILFRQNNFTEAIRAYDYALAIEPNDTLTRLQRGHCLFNLGQFNEAISPYEEYLAEHPDDAIVITFLAETYENIDNLQRAKELYLQALEIDDEISEAWILWNPSLYSKKPERTPLTSFPCQTASSAD